MHETCLPVGRVVTGDHTVGGRIRVRWTVRSGEQGPQRAWAPAARVCVENFDELVAHGLRAILGNAGWMVVAPGSDLALGNAPVDLVILNLRSLASGELARLSADQPDTRFAVLGERMTRRQAQALLRQGAAAALALSTPVRDLVAALRLAQRGLWVVHAQADPLDALSGAERRVYGLLCSGLSNGAIAQRLQLGEETIRTHARRIYAKLGVRGRHELFVPPEFAARRSQAS